MSDMTASEAQNEAPLATILRQPPQVPPVPDPVYGDD
jgi:hypothetical protein